MKILILTEYFPESEKAEITGGVESSCFNIVKELSKRHKVTVITSWRKGLKRKSRLFRADVYRVGINHPYSSSGDILSRLVFANAAYKKGVELGKFDIVNGYNFLTYLPAAKIAEKIGAKKIATYHESWLGEWRERKGFVTGILGEIWERNALNKEWDKIIAVSNQTKKTLVKNGVEDKKIKVIHNGVDLNRFKKTKAKKYKVFTIVCVSRLTKDKRVEDLINAMDVLVNKKKLKVKCNIIGKGDEENNLKELIEKNNLKNNVKLLGYLRSYDSVIREYKKSHLLAFPSVLEGFGLVLIEAMAAGIPYVCSDIDVFKEVSSDGKGGLLFKAKDHEDMAKKIESLVKNQRLYSQKQKEAIKYVKKFDWKNVAEKVEMVYKKIKNNDLNNIKKEKNYKQLKILYVSEYFPPFVKGGGEISGLNMIKEASKYHKCEVLTSNINGRKIDEIDGIRTYRYLKTGRNPESLISNIKRGLFYEKSLLIELRKLLQKEKYHVVHCLNMTSLAAVKLKKEFPRTRWVAHVNSPMVFCPKVDLMYKGEKKCNYICNWNVYVPCLLASEEVGKMKNNFMLKHIFRKKMFQRYVNAKENLKKFHRIVAISEFIKKELKKHGIKKNIYVVPNIVDAEKFKVKKVKNKIPKILFLSTYTKGKGVLTLLNALKGLKNYECNFYGDGPLEEEMKKFVAENKLNVNINKRVPEEKLPELHAKHDIIVFPSIVPEPFGRIAIEAMASKTLILAANSGAIPEFIDKKFLFKPGNVEELRKKLRYYMRNYRKIKIKFKDVDKYKGENVFLKLKEVYE